jgi:hypothetical protein
MIERRAGTGRELLLCGVVAGVLAMALVRAGLNMAVAALVGFAVGISLYLVLSLGGARKR